MESNKTLTIKPQEEQEQHQHFLMFNQILFCPRGLQFTLALLCMIFGLATCGQCVARDHLVPEMSGVPDPLAYDACGSHGDKCNGRVCGFLTGETGSISEHSPALSAPNSVCLNSDLFCFPSTLPGFLAEEDNYESPHAETLGSQNDDAVPEVSVPDDRLGSNSSWFSNHGSSMQLNGKIVLCSMSSGVELHDTSSTQGSSADWSNCNSCGGSLHKHHRPSSVSDKKSELIKSDLLDVSSSLKVEIHPPYLEWGQNYLHFPSSAFVTVANTCNDSLLQIYEPFSTDTQFYPCNFEEMLLGPGEIASICFVFLPQQLGLSSAHLILQTSSGGFLVHAKGFAIESLYRIQPLVGTDNSLDGRWSKNLSVYNPFDDTLYVKEITAWVSVSSENTFHSAEAVCRLENFQDFGDFKSFLNGMEWLDMMSDEIDLPMVAIRPHKSWVIHPHSAGTIMEINFLSGAKGKISGAFSLQLESSSQDRTDTIVVPLEAEVPEKADSSGLRSCVSVYLDSIVPCDGCETAAVLSLRNRANYFLKVVDVSEVTEGKKKFHIKYMGGLLLFPDTVTQIAVVTYSHLPGDSQEPPHEVFKLNSNCKLVILTNDSGSPPTEVSCQDVVQTRARHLVASHIREKHQHENGNSGDAVAGSLGSGVRSFSQSSHVKLKMSEKAEADELVLRSWISQGTTSGMSVLEDDEVLFPVVPIGSHCSKWITVKNPSEKPVVMQLILNSGAVIDQCKPINKFLQQHLSRSLVQNESSGPTGYGFSIAETAITEAYVHPYGKAFFGPIVFQPSNRCGWRSSALIRNNLSGVEWLPLRGFGGSFSLALLEGSKPVRSLEFNLNMPIPLNNSPQGWLFGKKDSSAACSVPISKEIFAVNTGDLPLEVRKMQVSGTDCGLDGFIIHSCKAFTLEPGESRRLLITYQSDFSVAMVHRDLEIALANGIHMIPMKASLPVYMITQCRKSFVWIFLKKLITIAIIAAGVMFVVSCFVLPQVMALGAQDYLFKNEDGIVSRGRKSHVQRNQNGMVKSVREDEISKLGFVGRYSDRLSHAHEPRTGQRTKPTQDAGDKIIGVTWPKTETPIVSYSEAKSGAFESETGNLTVKVGKEKSRRRRKRRSAGTGLTGLLEVSSSQSGNSTPSSPRSPVTFLAPKRIWPQSPDVDPVIEGRNPFAKLADGYHVRGQILPSTSLGPKVSGKSDSKAWSYSGQPQTPPPRKSTNKAVLLPSATFPSTSRCVPGVVRPSPFSPTSSAAVTPQARAPGANLCKQKAAEKVEDKGRRPEDDKFTYDIWGNHLSGIHLSGEVKGGVPRVVIAANCSEEDSQSFFVKGPQILMQSVPPAAPGLSPRDVTCFGPKG